MFHVTTRQRSIGVRHFLLVTGCRSLAETIRTIVPCRKPAQLFTLSTMISYADGVRPFSHGESGARHARPGMPTNGNSRQEHSFDYYYYRSVNIVW